MDLVNPAGICWTNTIGASRFFGSFGITLCSAFGPPVEQASATSLFFPVDFSLFGASSLAAGFAVEFILRTREFDEKTAFKTPSRFFLNSSPFASIMFVGFVTKSIAPRSIASIVTSASLLVSELTITTFARIFSFCNRSSNCRPSIRGILTSKITPS